jgi:predicted nucleic acid-binding protein
MIAVDTNILVFLYLPVSHSEKAEQLLLKEPKWIAPVLWRSEFRNVLALYLRKKLLTLEQCYDIQTEAEALLAGNEYDLPSLSILQLVSVSECSAYDCEFVALAKSFATKLVTEDKRVLSQFPDIAISLSDALLQH